VAEASEDAMPVYMAAEGPRSEDGSEAEAKGR
jgi:hypothetical protein